MQAVLAFGDEDNRSLRQVQREVGRRFRPDRIIGSQIANFRACRRNNAVPGYIDGDDELSAERIGAKCYGTPMQRGQQGAMRPSSQRSSGWFRARPQNRHCQNGTGKTKHAHPPLSTTSTSAVRHSPMFQLKQE